MKTKQKDYSWIWWIVIFALMCLFGQSRNIDGPRYPLEPPNEDYPEYESTQREYDPGGDYQLEPDDNDFIGYPEVDSDGSLSCPSGCTHYVQGCDIKGNISFETGEKIYHVPGQKYYASTTINSGYGERWFCSEAEAQVNGFRRSYQ